MVRRTAMHSYTYKAVRIPIRWYHWAWYCLPLCLLLIPIYLLYWHFADPYGGHILTQALCEEFKTGNVAGEMCGEICRDRTLHLRNFIKDQEGYRIFHWNDRFYRVRATHITKLQYDAHALKTIYGNPRDGTSMDEFRGMVDKMLSSRLGPVNHTPFLNRILATADVNKDSKVSLGEARTIWALLQHKEYFMMLLFHGSEYILNNYNFCGDVYSTEMVKFEELYSPPESGIMNTLLPNKYTWWFPKWQLRAKIVMGLLEFTQEAYQHGHLGTFYMCHTSEANIGYSQNHDAKILSIGDMLSKSELTAILGGRNCKSSHDCSYTQHCTTVCDNSTHMCTGDLMKPNLSLICRIISPFIIKGAPHVINGDLLHILDKCQSLNFLNKSFELDHALILNDLKLLLWKQISNTLQ